MEIYEDDDLILPLADQSPSQIPRSKLKRLKRKAAPSPPPSPPPAAAAKPPASPIVPSHDPEPTPRSPSPSIPDLPNPPRVPDVDVSQELGKEAVPNAAPNPDLDLDLDPLFAPPRFSEDADLQDLERDGQGDGEMMHLDLPAKGKSAKKRLIMDDEEAPASGPAAAKKKKRGSGKPDDKEGKSKESLREKKRIEKERKAQLEQIHAESQKLLRETRDASFKPVPLVQKPISSVLEKIRKRKLQVLKSHSVFQQANSVADMNSPADENSPEVKSTEAQNVDREEVCAASVNLIDSNMVEDLHVLDASDSQSQPDSYATDPNVKASDDDIKDALEPPSADTQASDDDIKETMQTGSTGTQDDSDESTPNEIDSKSLDDIVDGILRDVTMPTLSALNSKPDPVDVLSSEEDNDKENIAPYPKGGLAKAFVDDEAEEEDDSDHDLERFQENEEDDDDDENEDLKDLIATGFEEASVDHEKRNELHQKWLEQQDAAATDNFLQRLKSGREQKRHVLSYEDEDEDGEFDEDSEDEASCEIPAPNLVHKNSKKAKEMIAQMFNDGHDVYVPSDDEETEQTLIRQRLLTTHTEETTIISPLEDDNSREVFGLIKKLNIAPDSKRRGKPTSTFDKLMIGGSSNSSSRSSFLGRATSNSLPSSHKQGPSTVRAFIFGRDDSNSRSNLPTSENAVDKGQKENQPAKAQSTKFCSSQFKSIASRTKSEASKNSASSLFQILQKSSVHFDKQMEKKNGNITRVVTESQAVHQFSAFKLGKRFSKVEARI